MADLSQLSTEDLVALRSGDLTKVSDAGLLELRGEKAAKAPEPLAPKSQSSNGLGRQLGLTARAGITGVLGVPTMLAQGAAGVVNEIAGTNLDPAGALQRNLTRIGLPEPDGGVERVVQDVAGAIGGTGALAKIGQSVSPIINIGGSGVRSGAPGTVLAAPASEFTPATTIGDEVARQFSRNIGSQATAATAAATGGGATREMGGGPVAQIAAGLGAGVAVPMAATAAKNFIPNTIAKGVVKSEKTPFAVEGERLASETGIDLTVGARTGNKQILGLENAARQYGPTSDRVQDIDVKIANQAIDRVKSLASNISKNADSPDILGSQIEDTVKSAASGLANRRDISAAKDYGLVRQIGGGRPVVRLNNFADELKGIIGDYENVAGSDAQKITAQAKAALSRVTGIVEQGVPSRVIETPTGKNINLYGTPTVKGTMDNTVEEAMKTRSFYGKAAKGGANVFEDVHPNTNRGLAARLYGAINRDFEDAGTNAQGPLKQALDVANKNYRNYSQSIEFLEKSSLGKLVGDDLVDAALSKAEISTTAGEAVVNKIFGLHPSSRKTAVNILQTHNPSLVKDLKAHVLLRALDEGMAIPPSAKGATQVPLSFSRFISALGSQKVGFSRQLESYGFNKKEISDIHDTAVAMMRAGDKTGFNYSNTNVQAQNMEIVGEVGHAAASGMVWGVGAMLRAGGSGLLRIAGKRIGMNKIADAMATEEGRRALKTITKPFASPIAITEAFTTIEQQGQQ